MDLVRGGGAGGGQRPAAPAHRLLARLPLCAVLLAALTAGACGGSKEPQGPAVATPSLTLDRSRIAIGSPVTLTYKFQVAAGAAFDGDYTVFVHVLNPDGDQLWTDDHMPPTPTSQWKPGQTVEYTRRIFVPNYPYIGDATIRLGLYRGDTRLALDATEISRREYKVSEIQILPQSENLFLVDKEGWHPAEVSTNDPTDEWNWTDKRAVLSFRNPKRDATFYLEFDARSDLFTPPQQVTVMAGSQQIGSFTADGRERRLMTFPITAAQFGNEEMAEITIETDRTFKPGGGDPRELGLRVFHKFVEPAK
jgi:hypothetical protein